MGDGMPTIPHALLKDFAYYGTGGPCDVLYAPADVAELAAVVAEVNRRRQPLCLLGAGTNSLVMDDEFHGAFLVFRNLQDLRRDGVRLTAGAGVENTLLSQTALRSGLTGAAWMNRLPGQLGGTVRMNARCYGGEISQIVTRVTAVARDGTVRVYDDLGLVFRGYKDTLFMTNGDLIADVELTLAPGDAAAIAQTEAQMRFCASDREGKGQFEHPSCGCVFKNDYGVGVPSGMLLEAAGVKALKHGGAEVSPYHANFVYNKGATSRAILELTLMMRERVFKMFGAWLEYEMEILGTMPADLAGAVNERRAHALRAEAIRPLKEKMARRGD
jgi:UDP-N-acetylmuramate dehydrogenase